MSNVSGNYTLGELHAAFLKVANKRDWQSPIIAIVKEGRQEITAAAIKHFTNTEAKFSPFEGRAGTYWVEAVGKRVGATRAYEAVIQDQQLNRKAV